MEDIIEFANENLGVELDHDLLSYNPGDNRTISSNNERVWETSGIGHLLNSSTATNEVSTGSAVGLTAVDFPSSSSSNPPPVADEVAVPPKNSSSSSRASRRKRNLIDPMNKKPRIDYKTPFHAERLNTAIDAVISALRGDPGAFHRNITLIAKSHDIPYNTLRDNVLRARGIEPRAHRNSERKRQAEAVAAAAERGVEYKAPKSTLQLQTVRVSILIGDALAASDHRFDSTPDNNDNNSNHHSGSVPSARINGHIPPGNIPLPLLPEMRILAPLDLLKVPMSDGVTPHVKIEDVGAINIPHEVLVGGEHLSNGTDHANFPKFLPLNNVRQDSDSDGDISNNA